MKFLETLLLNTTKEYLTNDKSVAPENPLPTRLTHIKREFNKRLLMALTATALQI